MFDDIMERCCQSVEGNKWMLACDQPENSEVRIILGLMFGDRYELDSLKMLILSVSVTSD